MHSSVAQDRLIGGLLFEPTADQTLRCDRETGSERCIIETEGADPVVYDSLWAVRVERRATRRGSKRNSKLVFRDRRGTHDVMSWIDNDDAKRVAQWYDGNEPRIEITRSTSPSMLEFLYGGLALTVVILVVWIIRKLRPPHTHN